MTMRGMTMKVILHDLPVEKFNELIGNREDTIIISGKEPAAYCTGCYGCWLKKPGKCVMKDRLEDAGAKVMQAEELIIISRCLYGGYSPEIKRIMDRSIPGVMPFFVRKNGEMHHSARYDNQMSLKVYFYSETTEEEKELAKELIVANGLNFWARETEVNFVDETKLGEVL